MYKLYTGIYVSKALQSNKHPMNLLPVSSSVGGASFPCAPWYLEYSSNLIICTWDKWDPRYSDPWNFVRLFWCATKYCDPIIELCLVFWYSINVFY